MRRATPWRPTRVTIHCRRLEAAALCTHQVNINSCTQKHETTTIALFAPLHRRTSVAKWILPLRHSHQSPSTPRTSPRTPISTVTLAHILLRTPPSHLYAPIILLASCLRATSRLSHLHLCKSSCSKTLPARRLGAPDSQLATIYTHRIQNWYQHAADR